MKNFFNVLNTSLVVFTLVFSVPGESKLFKSSDSEMSFQINKDKNFTYLNFYKDKSHIRIQLNSDSMYTMFTKLSPLGTGQVFIQKTNKGFKIGSLISGPKIDFNTTQNISFNTNCNSKDQMDKKLLELIDKIILDSNLVDKSCNKIDGVRSAIFSFLNDVYGPSKYIEGCKNSNKAKVYFDENELLAPFETTIELINKIKEDLKKSEGNIKKIRFTCEPAFEKSDGSKLEIASRKKIGNNKVEEINEIIFGVDIKSNKLTRSCFGPNTMFHEMIHLAGIKSEKNTVTIEETCNSNKNLNYNEFKEVNCNSIAKTKATSRNEVSILPTKPILAELDSERSNLVSEYTAINTNPADFPRPSEKDITTVLNEPESSPSYKASLGNLFVFGNQAFAKFDNNLESALVATSHTPIPPVGESNFKPQISYPKYNNQVYVAEEILADPNFSTPAMQLRKDQQDNRGKPAPPKIVSNAPFVGKTLNVSKAAVAVYNGSPNIPTSEGGTNKEGAIASATQVSDSLKAQEGFYLLKNATMIGQPVDGLKYIDLKRELNNKAFLEILKRQRIKILLGDKVFGYEDTGPLYVFKDDGKKLTKL